METHAAAHAATQAAAYAETRETRKPRGAFYTPEPLARFIADWAVRSPSDRVLEPSCGEAVFLEAAARRLNDLGGEPASGQLLGVDLHAASVDRARIRLRAAGVSADLVAADFFDHHADVHVDAVIGNPPYIRYQDFTGPARLKARRAALGAGVRLTALASSWAAFTVHAATFLADGGRLGLVLPAELLSVNYAAGVREFLLHHFRRVRLVLFTERVFPDVQEEVVLLLAEDYVTGVGPGADADAPGTDHFEVVQVTNATELGTDIRFSPWQPAAPGAKWTAALAVSPEYESLVGGGSFAALGGWGRLALGAVTGANRFFALSPRRCAELGLGRRDVVPLSPPGSLHLRAVELTEAAVGELGEADARTRLFSPGPTPSRAARRYITAGESLGIHQGYKCRGRTPWWQVPIQEPADLFVTYMNADGVALCANTAGVLHLNSVHGLFLGDQARAVPPALLALATRSTVTALGAETIGRAYGGGMLKVEPREAAALPVPAVELVTSVSDELAALLPEARSRLRHREPGAELAVRMQVDSILGRATGTNEASLAELRRAHASLVERRRARARRAGA